MPPSQTKEDADMAINFNPNIQNIATIAWDRLATYYADIRGYNSFGWTFEVNSTLTTDAVFTVISAPPSEADNCLPGAFTPVAGISSCAGETPEALVAFVIPAGTPAGSTCSATLPCKPNAFVSLVPSPGVGGADSVKVCLIRQGPH
jgi:hypothetical protein